MANIRLQSAPPLVVSTLLNACSLKSTGRLPNFELFLRVVNNRGLFIEMRRALLLLSLEAKALCLQKACRVLKVYLDISSSGSDVELS